MSSLDGRLRLHETWAWDSQPGSGTSVVEEVASLPPNTALARRVPQDYCRSISM
jgi:hypothetical protein